MPASKLPEGSLDRLNGVKVAILAQHQMPEPGQQPLRVAAAVELAGDQRAGLVDLLLAVQRLG